MNDARRKLLEKIKALLNQNGRTEEEVISFLAKARELMATYEISEAELKEFEERVTTHRTTPNDPYKIKATLSMAVGAFTRCVGYGGRVNPVTFIGLESDVIFATWLLDTLQMFVMRALREYQKQRSLKKMTNSNFTSASFVAGCVHRIKEKLDELTVEMPAKNKAMIEADMTKNGIVLRKSSKRGDIHGQSAMAGNAAGNHARFDKPVGAGGTKRLK